MSWASDDETDFLEECKVEAAKEKAKEKERLAAKAEEEAAMFSPFDSLCDEITPIDARSIGLALYQLVKQWPVDVKTAMKEHRELMAFAVQYRLMKLFYERSMTIAQLEVVLMRVMARFSDRIYGDKSYVHAKCIKRRPLTMLFIEERKKVNEKEYVTRKGELPPEYVALVGGASIQ